MRIQSWLLNRDCIVPSKKTLDRPASSGDEGTVERMLGSRTAVARNFNKAVVRRGVRHFADVRCSP